ncbi:MAG: hypothetical protein RIR26_69 [Pseudomonadota bacterium]|jgi:hypothetical protein
MMKDPRLHFSLGFISSLIRNGVPAMLALVVFCLGCQRVELPQIGNRIDSPIALASHPRVPVSYVLNASLGGEFETGSLQAFTQGSDGRLNVLSSVKVPRLGTAVAVAPSGGFLIAGFSGSGARLHVYSLDAQGVPALADKNNQQDLPSGRVSHVQIVQLPGRSDWVVVVTMADRSFDAQVLVYQFDPVAGFTRRMSAPRDFYVPDRDNLLGNYTMAWGSPVVFESLGLLVAFPYGSLGYLGINPTALDWLSGKASSGDTQYDLRTVSALVVDLNRLLTGSAVESSVGYVPLAFNAEGKKGDATQASNTKDNESYGFRVSYQSALALDAQGSFCEPNAPLSALGVHTAVVVTNTAAADVIALSGFNLVANQLRAQLDQNKKQPVLGDLVQSAPVSLTQKIPDLVDSAKGESIPTLVPQMGLIKSGGLCTLALLRVEQRRSSLGEEKSRIQVVTAENPAQQLQIESERRGLAAMTINGDSLFAGSFGSNQILQFKFDGSSLRSGGVLP